ncbi:ATP-binding protein [Sphingomonas glacialis]|uniref:ATP-binding protein n=1 Tax=Sphingomonas glacialis TaxID=658225 RepID=UPI0011269750|nr:triple tyrosine motif-containing protein [Sphingomonas glacialis]
MIGSGIATDATGAMFAGDGSTLFRLKGNTLRKIDLARYALGDITNVVSNGQGFLVSTTRGLIRIQGDRIRTLDATRFPWTRGLREIVQTSRGETWLYGTAGVVRIASNLLNRAFDAPGQPVRTRLFDFRDGLFGSPQRRGFVGMQAAVGGDGRIWFATSAGLAGIDPAAVYESAGAPPVSIRSLAAGARTFRDPSALILPPGTRSIRIAYAAASLSAPERVQFRYRLSGVDTDWVDPGTRRATNYTNLGPGKYQFQVIAGNEAGVWNRRGATLDFEIRPTFVQSVPFRILCGVLVVALLWLAYRVRIRAVSAQVRANMAVRHDERERIARELHDTLLQSVTGLILRFQHATISMPPDLPERKTLEAALDGAEDVIAQGRDRVRALRPPEINGDAETLLTEIVRTPQHGGPPFHSVTVYGEPRLLTPAAADEIAGIANEAVINIARHAAATKVDVTIQYRAEALVIRLRDDGIGFDPLVLRTGMRDGHFGLVGMRERARTLGAELIFDNAPAGGAEVTLVVPAPKAFGFDRSFAARMWQKGLRLLRSG